MASIAFQAAFSRLQRDERREAAGGEGTLSSPKESCKASTVSPAPSVNYLFGKRLMIDTNQQYRPRRCFIDRFGK